jgi:hypothetical protein
MASDGFIWSGSLDDTDIQSLYAACQSLRFSGKLELRDGSNKADVTFVGGEPIEIDGGDTQRIALWNRGTFRAVQSIPNLSGELTGQLEMQGSLAITKASQLWAWVSEYRLTCEIDLDRPGSKAVVSFVNGHAESAKVNDMPELAALARVSSWTDGTFRVRLKPLFIDGVIPVAPPMPEGAPPLGRNFDVSRSIPMDLRPREHQKMPKMSFGPPRPTHAAASPSTGPRPSSTARPHAERTSETRPLPPSGSPGRRRNPFDPVEPSKPYPKHEVVRPRPKLPWVLSLCAIIVAGGLGALYYYHLPPFSKPPKPVETQPTADSQQPTAPEQKTPEPSGEAAKPSSEPPKPPSGQAHRPASSGETPKPIATAKKPEAAKEKPTDKLMAKGRLALIEGHGPHALDLFRRAIKMAPKDASLKVYEQQALGKLGKAELLLDGKGSVVVDGHKFIAPRKLKIFAGPHMIDTGDGEEEVSLKRGEKRHVRVKK